MAPGFCSEQIAKRLFDKKTAGYFVGIASQTFLRVCLRMMKVIFMRPVSTVLETCPTEGNTADTVEEMKWESIIVIKM